MERVHCPCGFEPNAGMVCVVCGATPDQIVDLRSEELDVQQVIDLQDEAPPQRLTVVTTSWWDA